MISKERLQKVSKIREALSELRQIIPFPNTDTGDISIDLLSPCSEMEIKVEELFKRILDNSDQEALQDLYKKEAIEIEDEESF